jgi:hypothetical protein
MAAAGALDWGRGRHEQQFKDRDGELLWTATPMAMNSSGSGGGQGPNGEMQRPWTGGANNLGTSSRSRIGDFGR